MLDVNFKTKENEISALKTTLISRNIAVMGRRTSIRLEPEMWLALREISTRERCTIHDICTLVSVRKNPRSSLTASIRVFLMLYFRAASTEEGHSRASHGNFESMMQRARIPSQALSTGIGRRRVNAQPFNNGSVIEAKRRSLEEAF
jgi:predicted DNA-binding ribbon-helix-helix protein